MIRKLNGVKSELPKEKNSIKNFFLNCNKRKKLIQDTPNHFKNHLKKAKHDLARAIAEFEDGCWDWTVIKAYYAIHHAANALLSKKKNVFSKDHLCLIISLKYYNLINKELFEELTSIHEKFSDALSLELTFKLRKISQYSVDEWEDITKEDASLLLNLAKKFISYVEQKITQ